MKSSGMLAIVPFPPPPVITAPAGSDVAVEAVFVPVYIQVELMVALTPWACHAPVRVVVNSRGVSTIVLVAAAVAEPEVADAEGVRVLERMVSGAIDPVCEGKVDAEAAADAGCEEEDTAAASDLVEVAARMDRSAEGHGQNQARGWPLHSCRASSRFAIDLFTRPVDSNDPNKPIEYVRKSILLS